MGLIAVPVIACYFFVMICVDVVRRSFITGWNALVTLFEEGC